MGVEEKQYQLQRMSKHDKEALEAIGMKLYDEKGDLRLWDDIVTDYMNNDWKTLSGTQKEDALLLLVLVKYRLEHGFTWD